MRPGSAGCRRGFTVIELLTVLAVMAVLTAVALPQMATVTNRAAVAASISSLAGALRLARSEAVKRGEHVTVCARDPASGDQDTNCAPAGKDWSAGWLVFVDRGQRGRLDPDDVLLASYRPERRSLQVVATVRYLSFEGTGISLSAASHFDFLPEGQPLPGARRACINKPGRLRVLDDVQPCAS